MTQNADLELMMKMQKTLQENAYGYDFSSLAPAERTALIKEMTIHDTQETHEMLYELPFFKPWKDYTGMTDVEIGSAMNKAKEEFIDKFHFMMNIALLLEMSSEEIVDRYMKKNQENYERQTEGYTHDKSYRA